MQDTNRALCLVWCIIGEVESVLSILKNHFRHTPSHLENFQLSPNRLVKKLRNLRKKLRTCVSAFEAGETGTIDRVEIIRPFLDVIRSNETAGEVTNVALQSVVSLMQFGLFEIGKKEAKVRAQIPQSLFLLVESVAGCRFEMTDASFDERVLFNVLLCLKMATTSPLGQYLDDQSFWISFEVIFRMSQETRRSKILKLAAVSALVSIVHTIFSGFNEAIRREKMGFKGKDVAKSVHFFYDENIEVEKNISSKNEDTSSKSLDVSLDRSFGLPVILKLLNFLVSTLDPNGVSPIVRKLIAGEVDHSKIQKIGLRLLNIALCDCGLALSRFKPAVMLIGNDLCKYLIQTMLVAPNFLYSSLQIFRTLVIYLRVNLKTQIEAVFNAVYLRALSGSIKSRESIEIVLESLSDLGSIPTLWTELYINFDCDPRCTNVLENLCKFLSKNTFPIFIRVEKLHVLGYTQLLSLKCLIHGLKFIATRSENVNTVATDNSFSGSRESSDIEQMLRKARKQKELIGRIVGPFNAKPKHAVKLLEDAGLISNNMSEVARATIVSDFLRYTPLLKKAAVGQYLASGDDTFSHAVRSKYIDTFNLCNRPMLTALRTFLEAFRLPGEAQQIDRLLQAFANETYTKSSDAPLMATADVAYLLSFSIIMLNTDLHNPNIKAENKMSLGDFVKQNKNYGSEVSAGVDLPFEFLVNIYNSIKTNEIRKFEDGDDGGLLSLVTDNLWSDIISRGQNDIKTPAISGIKTYIQLRHANSKDAPMTKTNANFYDTDVYCLIWSSTISALSVTFDTVNEGKIMELALDGFILNAKIAATYQLCPIFDNIVGTLLRFSTWIDENPLASKYCTEDVGVSRSAYNVHRFCDAAINQFGANHKAQMATVAVFGLVRKFGSCLRTAWKSVLHCILQIKVVGLLPRELTEIFPDGISTERSEKHFESLARKVIQLDEAKASVDKNSSIFSWIFGSTGDRPKIITKTPHASKCIRVLEDILKDDLNEGTSITEDDRKGIPDADSEGILKAARCIKSCYLVDVLSDTKLLGNDSLLQLLEMLMLISVESLVSDNNEYADTKGADTNDNMKALKVSVGLQEDVHTLGSLPRESICFCIYWITQIVLDNRDRLQLTLNRVLSFLSQILLSEDKPNSITNMAGRGLLRLVVRLSHKSKLIDTLLHSLLIFTTIPTYPRMDLNEKRMTVTPIVGNALAGFVGTAVATLVKLNAANITAPIAWRDLFAILNTCAKYEVSCRDGFAALSFLLLDPHMRACVPLTVTSTVVAYASSSHGDSQRKADQNVSSSTFYSTDAIDLLYSLHERVGPLIERFSPGNRSNVEHDFHQNVQTSTTFDAWADCWRPVLTSMATCLDDDRENVSLHALCVMEKSLSDCHGSNMSAGQWKKIFTQLLFPILAKFLEGQTLRVKFRDMPQLDEKTAHQIDSICSVQNINVIVSVIKMVAKVFLFRLEVLSNLSEFDSLWLNLLQFLQRFLIYGREVQALALCETILEIIKNIVLVMQKMRLFDVDTDDEQLWHLTSKALSDFCSEEYLQKLNILI